MKGNSRTKTAVFSILDIKQTHDNARRLTQNMATNFRPTNSKTHTSYKLASKQCVTLRNDAIPSHQRYPTHHDGWLDGVCDAKYFGWVCFDILVYYNVQHNISCMGICVIVFLSEESNRKEIHMMSITWKRIKLWSKRYERLQSAFMDSS